MRTTLTIDEDVLAAARGLAMVQHKSIGQILSSLARQALKPNVSSCKMRNGIPLLMPQAEGTIVTLELVNQLRDDLP